METHSCKFCPRSFPSGRSLGGHMRSHVMKLSSSNNAENSQTGYGLRENPKKSCRFEETGESISKAAKLCGKKHGGEPEIGEEYEEEEALGKVRGRKSKLIETVSATSSSPSPSSPEYGALCLMMLSRGASPVSNSSQVLNRSKSEFHNIGLKKVEFFPSDIELGKRMRSTGEDLDFDFDFEFGTENLYKRSRYDCLICNKSFHSYQALGGHCASHKKIKQETSSVSRRKEDFFSGGFRTHRCEICDKIFSSGQALGGHKRSHLVSDNASCSSSTAAFDEGIGIVGRNWGKKPLDLNLPASDFGVCDGFESTGSRITAGFGESCGFFRLS